MKTHLLAAPLLLLTFAIPVAAAPDGTADHTEALKILKADIAAKPSRVLVAVEDALTMDEQGACEIVKSAITLTKADTRLVGEIVYTALKHSPGMSAIIVECAVDTAPQAAGEIKKAMQRALGETSGDEEATEDIAEGSGKAPAKEESSGKQPSGKEPSGKGKVAVEPEPVPEDDQWDLWQWHHGVGGIYLTPPSVGLSNGGYLPPVTPP